MNKNIIELNGKQYDAVSGVLLGNPADPRSFAPSSVQKKGRAVDGFVRLNTPAAVTFKPKSMTKALVLVKKTDESALEPATSAKTAAPHAHATAKIITAHRPEHAKTLVRRAVHKPQMSLKPAIKSQSPAELAARPVATVTHKRSVAAVDPARLARAQQIPKHSAVKRFMQHTGLAASPKQNVAYHVQTHVPVIAVRPAPVAAKQTPVDMFEAAIAHATSHTQPLHHIPRSRRRKMLNVLAGTAAFLVIGSFIAFLNAPNIELHVASITAGFKATMPGYAPYGYALTNGVKRTGNTVSLVYRSGADSYTLTEQSSNWDNQTLLENTLALQSNHQTIENAGTTIFVYNGNNAVWVNGNVRYDLIGNAPLSGDDISKLATSL